jgi:hypothetical protein
MFIPKSLQWVQFAPPEQINADAPVEYRLIRRQKVIRMEIFFRVFTFFESDGLTGCLELELAY